MPCLNQRPLTNALHPQARRIAGMCGACCAPFVSVASLRATSGAVARAQARGPPPASAARFPVHPGARPMVAILFVSSLCRRWYARSTHANPARPRAMVTRSLAPVCHVRYCMHSIVAAIVVSILAERAACRCCPRCRPQWRGRHGRVVAYHRCHRADIGGAMVGRRAVPPPPSPGPSLPPLPRWPPSPPPAPMPSASPLAPVPLPLCLATVPAAALAAAPSRRCRPRCRSRRRGIAAAVAAIVAIVAALAASPSPPSLLPLSPPAPSDSTAPPPPRSALDADE